MIRESSSKLGINKTGIDLSPIDGRAMVEAAEGTPRSGPNGQSLLKWRVSFATQGSSVPIGSVPPPGTLKGLTKSAMDMLMGKQPTVFVDQLGARLAFERTGTRVYEAMLAKVDSRAGAGDGALRSHLEQFHHQELMHFQWVRNAMEKLGVDPTAQTPAADVAGVASQGVLQVVTDPRTTVTQCLQALIIAELTDREGWSTLVKLAATFGQNDMVESFNRAIADEQLHLDTVRRWLHESYEAEAHNRKAS